MYVAMYDASKLNIQQTKLELTITHFQHRAAVQNLKLQMRKGTYTQGFHMDVC